MKAIIITLLLVISPLSHAGCEATIVEGSHTALLPAEAKAGAWEEAKDSCYPGDAQKLDEECSLVSGSQGIQGKPAFRCKQTASCTVCGDDLTRKYEALD